MRKEMSEKQRATLANALHTAAQAYLDSTETCGHAGIAAQFRAQAAEAKRMQEFCAQHALRAGEQQEQLGAAQHAEQWRGQIYPQVLP